MVKTLTGCFLALAGLLAAPAAFAKSAREQMFPTESSCYARAYSDTHLARNPVQRVTDIALTPDPGTQSDPLLRLWLKVRMRGSTEVLEALSYCEANGATVLYCEMEGDAGGFSIRPARDGAVLVTVGSLGIGLEGSQGFVTLEHNRGDDRSFLLAPTGICK